MKKSIIVFAIIAALSLFAVGCAGGAVEAAATAAPTAVEVVVSTEAPTATVSLTASPAPKATATATMKAGSAADGTLELTLDQLKQYDGKNGNPAYIAVDGVLYDVTNVGQWKNGGHEGYSAGNDLTDAIKNSSPHGTSKLKGVPVVGKLIAG